MVLLLGQYSVGKTSFIRSLLGRDFPGIRIGPEPTTDRFLAVMRADDGFNFALDPWLFHSCIGVGPASFSNSSVVACVYGSGGPVT